MRFILLVLLFCGCATSWDNDKYLRNDEGQVAMIHGSQLAFHFQRFGINPVVVDQTYAIINSDWLDEFLKFHAFHRKELGLKWETFWDCDSFARDFANLADLHHGPTSGAEAIAIGEVFYKTDEGGYHAINLALTDKGIVFIEPQISEIVELSNAEKMSIFYIRF